MAPGQFKKRIKAKRITIAWTCQAAQVKATSKATREARREMIDGFVQGA